MANNNPPVKGVAFTTYLPLKDFTNAARFKSNPTLAAGDVKVSKDGGALANLTNLPAVTPASSIWVEVSLTSTEMNADKVAVQFIDQSDPPEWCDEAFTIMTTP